MVFMIFNIFMMAYFKYNTLGSKNDGPSGQSIYLCALLVVVVLSVLIMVLFGQKMMKKKAFSCHEQQHQTNNLQASASAEALISKAPDGTSIGDDSCQDDHLSRKGKCIEWRREWH